MGVLLLGADYYGTLAAARCYGKSGVAVAMADDNRRARGLSSRWVSQKLTHPSMTDPDGLVDWLVRFGERNPGTLLYPPNDHLAWLFAEERERLGKVFVMYSPAEDVIITLLDKSRLHQACAKVGIDVPETHELDPNEARAPFIDELRWPVLLKPRTQIFMEGGVKGIIVQDRASLASELARYQSTAMFNRVLTRRHPEIAAPMVQEYLTAAETNIFSVSGFVSKEGDFVARAAMKVLQRPRKVGIGLCFEGREIEPDLESKLRALCQSVGYFGAFESEFIVLGNKRLLIDFNPRFYSQMAFDIARGLRLPILVAHAARGDRASLAAELDQARAWKPTGHEVYCHKTMLDVVLTMQGLSGEMPRAEREKWRRWVSTNRAGLTDAVRDPADRKPALVDAVQWAEHFVRHPRSFIRNFVLNK